MNQVFILVVFLHDQVALLQSSIINTEKYKFFLITFDG